jgi:hypothetical protein
MGYVVVDKASYLDPPWLYNQDGLVSSHNDDFMHDQAFQRAYERGLKAAHGIDPHHHWRVHVALWVARLATRAQGDFIECGVNAGFMSSAIMEALNWNRLGRRFYLVDSFSGPRMDQFTRAEHESGFTEKIQDAVSRGAYVTDMERIHQNFAEWTGVEIIQGFVPEALDELTSRQFAFVHLDMNASIPEQQALRHLWPIMPDGGAILLDDYAYCGCEAQKIAIDELGSELGFSTLSLPTGQGLVIKGT